MSKPTLVSKIDALIEATSTMQESKKDNATEEKAVDATHAFIEKSWKDSVLSTLCEYIEIPNQSPSYDPEIFTNGFQEKAMNLLVKWVKNQNVKGLKIETFADENRTPLIFMEIEGTLKNKDCSVLMYGHFDKQPPLTQDWDDDLHPWKAIIKNGKLYGRGGADDGYAIFAAIDSIRALQAQNKAYPRICIVIEGSEESGSIDLWHYLDKLSSRIGTPDVVICLDSGCSNYSQLWMTVSLRGIVVVNLKAQLLKEGIHSGNSGYVRDSFHILRLILDRIDNAETGEMMKDLSVEIPKNHVQFAKDCAKCLGKENIMNSIPFYDRKECKSQLGDCENEKMFELILNRTWRPQLSITGIDGIPDLKGGNVLRKYTTLKLSIRVPPNKDVQEALKQIKQTCEAKPSPFGANVTIEGDDGHAGGGMVTPEFEGWLMDSMQKASKTYFDGKSAQFQGEGGSIPFMGDLQKKFPKSQFVITGVLGPGSNAHGPNEFLHIKFCKRVICCVSSILYDIGQKYEKIVVSEASCVISDRAN